jgi:hypothetical protein
MPIYTLSVCLHYALLFAINNENLLILLMNSLQNLMGLDELPYPGFTVISTIGWMMSQQVMAHPIFVLLCIVSLKAQSLARSCLSFI